MAKIHDETNETTALKQTLEQVLQRSNDGIRRSLAFLADRDTHDDWSIVVVVRDDRELKDQHQHVAVSTNLDPENCLVLLTSAGASILKDLMRQQQENENPNPLSPKNRKN